MTAWHAVGLPLVGAAVPLTAATPSPTSTGTASVPASRVDPDSVTPGVAGFLVVFFLALATWLLMRNMTARLRRLRFREAERLRGEASHPPKPDPEPGRHPDL